ncbi:hypothetical protein AOA57_29400 [Pseudomonas sp. 2588-5]|nr:hypothetical protein AOA57_29400 [Pseudomonas sp. 2588-5]
MDISNGRALPSLSMAFLKKHMLRMASFLFRIFVSLQVLGTVWVHSASRLVHPVTPLHVMTLKRYAKVAQIALASEMLTEQYH